MRIPSGKQYVLVLLSFVLFGIQVEAQSDAFDAYAGYYCGLEVGTISYNTQITFDGVDDPAGRGGFGYGAFGGYNVIIGNILFGGELFYNAVKEPDPYTFDPMVIGFSDLDLKRNASIGLDLKVGFFLLRRLLFYGSLGYSSTKQSVLIDGIPLEQFSGGSGPKRLGKMLYGIGLEVLITESFTTRFSFEATQGHDLDRADFGIIATNASLQRLDVEPSLLQFFIGTTYRF